MVFPLCDLPYVLLNASYPSARLVLFSNTFRLGTYSSSVRDADQLWTFHPSPSDASKYMIRNFQHPKYRLLISSLGTLTASKIENQQVDNSQYWKVEITGEGKVRIWNAGKEDCVMGIKQNGRDVGVANQGGEGNEWILKERFEGSMEIRDVKMGETLGKGVKGEMKGTKGLRQCVEKMGEADTIKGYNGKKGEGWKSVKVSEWDKEDCRVSVTQRVVKVSGWEGEDVEVRGEIVVCETPTW